MTVDIETVDIGGKFKLLKALIVAATPIPEARFGGTSRAIAFILLSKFSLFKVTTMLSLSLSSITFKTTLPFPLSLFVLLSPSLIVIFPSFSS